MHVLIENGVETYESCQGGEGHCAHEPFVRFHGDRFAGLKALAVAMEHALPVAQLRRFWCIVDGEVDGPRWELTFTKPDHSYKGYVKGLPAVAS